MLIIYYNSFEVKVLNNPIIEPQMTYTKTPDTSLFNMHTHDNYEIYCFLAGSAKYFVEGNTYSLKPGDILIMKKAEAHSLLITKQNPYKRIVINFNSDAISENMRSKLVEFLENRPLGIKNRFSASHFSDTNWLYYIEKICENDDKNIQSVYLTVLLSELYERFPEIETQEALIDGIMDIVKYINFNLSGELNLDIICERFFISKSHLNKKFKKIIGTTVWEYISTKRLMLAKELLQNGIAPTNVYSQCGFKDYCTFFRAYKAKFGISPKNSNK